MTKVGELELLPVPGWSAVPTYFIGAGGIGYLVVSWLMYYLGQNRPAGSSMDDFTGAQFRVIDFAGPDKTTDLPPQDWVGENRVFQPKGDLNHIINAVLKGNYPGIADFYDVHNETENAREARRQVSDLKDGAGTTPPFGRIGFFYNWDSFYGDLQNFLTQPCQPCPMKFGRTFNVNTEQGQRNFFIVSSLAGGTGSSCFLDIAATLRHLRTMKYSSEKWRITGVFTLADVLAVDSKINQELKRSKMKANTYSALKELHHFLGGEAFTARYGMHGQHEVRVVNQEESDQLFDVVLLVDTPNQDDQPLSGRREVAQFLAQSLLLLGVTEICGEFFNRHVDTRAVLTFKELDPPQSTEGVVREHQQCLFSSIGLCTLSFPVIRMLEYANTRLARNLLKELATPGGPGGTDGRVDRIFAAHQIDPNSIDRRVDERCPLPLASRNECYRMIQDAANPMEAIRNLVNQMQGIASIEEIAQNESDDIFLSIFPPERGALKEQIDTLVSKGEIGSIPGILLDLEGRLSSYKSKLTNELADAVLQAGRGEAPDSIAPSGRSLFDNILVIDLLQTMENSWNNWGSRFLRGPFRGRFLNRFQGRVWDLIDFLLRVQKNGAICMTWRAKISLADRLLTELEKLREEYRGRLNHFQNIQVELDVRLRNLESAISQETRFVEMALPPQDYFNNVFKKQLPDSELFIKKLCEEIRENGLLMQDGTFKKPENWGGCPVVDLAEALKTFCMQTTCGGPLNEELDIRNAGPVFKTGLDHEHFLPKNQPSSFDKVLARWKGKANISVNFNAGRPREVLRYIVSGCRTQDPYSWEKALNLFGLSTKPGGAPSQAALLSVALGFSPRSIKRVEHWYETAYVPLVREGWPIHRFKAEQAEAMVEPFLEWMLRLPNIEEAKQLVEEAIELKIIPPLKLASANGKGRSIPFNKNLLDTLPVRISRFFYETGHSRKDFPQKLLRHC